MKEIVNRDYHVIIEPKSLGDCGVMRFPDRHIEPDEEKRNQRYEEMCEEIARQVKRHIDGVGYVAVVWDSREVCSFCGYDWEVDENGVPLCCEKAVEEYKEEE